LGATVQQKGAGRPLLADRVFFAPEGRHRGAAACGRGYGVSPKRIANNMATASAVNSSRVCVGDIDHMGG